MTSSTSEPFGEPLWGIDLGGTKIEGVVLRSPDDPAPLARLRLPTEAARGYRHILERIHEVVRQLGHETGLAPRSLGMGTPGVLDPATLRLKNSNTQCLNGQTLRTDLEALLGVPVSTANDANCFALAEARFGAARGSATSFGVIMGTGVGGGIVVGGAALYGAQGIAGEWGHNVIEWDGTPCYCGKRGCVETVLSGPALERFHAERSGRHLSLHEIAVEYEAGKTGAAAETMERLVTYFGRALSVVVNILDPEVIVLGGGVSNVPLLYSRGIEEVKRSVFNDGLATRIVKHSLGDSAGVLGAALLCG